LRSALPLRLVVPRDLWDDLPPQARSGILRHEAAHDLRRDAWKSLAVRILMLPHWFNPFAHLAGSEVRRGGGVSLRRSGLHRRSGKSRHKRLRSIPAVIFRDIEILWEM